MIIQSYTWDRECHGLYDFDLQYIDKIENRFVGCGYIQRNQNNINIQLPGLAAEQVKESKDDELDNLISIVYKYNSYWLFHNHSVNNESYKHHLKMAWHIVRYTQDLYFPKEQNRFYLQEGDIVKFGRVRFRIRKLNLNLSESNASNEEEGIGIDSPKNDS